MAFKQPTAAQIKSLRETHGMGMDEARAHFIREQVLATLLSRWWFLHIRSVLMFVVMGARR